MGYSGVLLGLAIWGVVLLAVGRLDGVALWVLIGIGWIMLPVGGFLDARHLGRTTTWRPNPLVWSIAFAMPLFNVVAALGYLWRRTTAEPRDAVDDRADQYSEISRQPTSAVLKSLRADLTAIGAEAPTVLLWMGGVALLLGAVVALAALTHLTINFIIILLAILFIAGAIIRAHLSDHASATSRQARRR